MEAYVEWDAGWGAGWVDEEDCDALKDTEGVILEGMR